MNVNNAVNTQVIRKDSNTNNNTNKINDGTYNEYTINNTEAVVAAPTTTVIVKKANFNFNNNTLQKNEISENQGYRIDL